MDSGNDAMLLKIAIFGIVMSVLSTCLVSVFIQGSSDYDYETIQNYRNELTTYSGGSLTNDTPWVLTSVYTPFIPGAVKEDEIKNHIDQDGWLFGERVLYPEIGKAADIKLDKDQKSNQLLSVGERQTYEYRNGKEWWNGGNDYGIVVIDPSVVEFFGNLWGQDTSDTGYVVERGQANNWAFSGYRYVFDPTLPFKTGASSKDGSLSIVWYQTENDTGISGGLQIYSNGRSASMDDQILLANYSAYDIVATYQSNNGYAQAYDFDFQGTHLNLSIRFDPLTYKNYSSLIDAWNAGAWTMAISSVSAGNFFDVENSNAFSLTAGGMFDTFIQIFTFDYPQFNDAWVDFVMWALVGLPFTIAMLCIVSRVVGGVFKFF